MLVLSNVFLCFLCVAPWHIADQQNDRPSLLCLQFVLKNIKNTPNPQELHHFQHLKTRDARLKSNLMQVDNIIVDTLQLDIAKTTLNTNTRHEKKETHEYEVWVWVKVQNYGMRTFNLLAPSCFIYVLNIEKVSN